MTRKRLSTTQRALLESMVDLGYSTLPSNHKPMGNLCGAGLVKEWLRANGSFVMWVPTVLGREWVADRNRSLGASAAPQSAKRMRAKAARARRLSP